MVHRVKPRTCRDNRDMVCVFLAFHRRLLLSPLWRGLVSHARRIALDPQRDQHHSATGHRACPQGLQSKDTRSPKISFVASSRANGIRNPTRTTMTSAMPSQRPAITTPSAKSARPSPSAKRARLPRPRHSRALLLRLHPSLRGRQRTHCAFHHERRARRQRRTLARHSSHEPRPLHGEPRIRQHRQPHRRLRRLSHLSYGISTVTHQRPRIIILGETYFDNSRNRDDRYFRTTAISSP